MTLKKINLAKSKTGLIFWVSRILLVLIQLFSLGVMAEALLAKID